jgi:putative addiction module component (TIGR02574 family)
MSVELAEILKLSVAERIQLVEDIWDSIEALPVASLTQAQRELLDRRIEAYKKDPKRGIAWEDLKAELLSRA